MSSMRTPLALRMDKNEWRSSRGLQSSHFAARPDFYRVECTRLAAG